MPRPVIFRSLRVAAIVALTALVGAGSTFAAPPNDDFANATTIPVPFSQSGDLDQAIVEPGEPLFCAFMQQTVWYKLTATSGKALKIQLSQGVPFNLYRDFGNGISGLGFLGCNGGNDSLEFVPTAGLTYYIQVGSFNTGTAPYQIDVDVVPPPLNDNFASAAAIGGVPFTTTVDLIAATIENGEPVPNNGPFGFNASVWYAFTPSVPTRVSANTSSCCVFATVTAFTGTSIDALTAVGTHGIYGQTLTFFADAGTTHYIQIGAGVGTSGLLTLELFVTPPVEAHFSVSPSDPSTFDTAQFFDNSSDPVLAGFQSFAWQFGDGTTGTGNGVTKRYAADGDYTVSETVTTVDGRTDSVSQVVPVRTHDIAIAKLTVPKSASAGQTRDITVGIRNHRYPDLVQVQFLRSLPGLGFQGVGQLMQLIPVRQGNGTTPVSFSYTFTEEDAAVGKVSFQAIVTILGARDVLPADNTAISTPTKVSH